MSENTHRVTRYISVVAATIASLACGTNYAYSAWGPQLAERLKLSATESNLIGTAGNLGMYACGVPLGMIVDSKGPRLPALLGAVLLGAGYYPIMKAYDDESASASVLILSFFSFLTGMGSCAAFQAALKTAALNWPQHRGTATAFPLAAFGLSAFFFTTIAGISFGHDTSSLLSFLAIATFAMVFVSMFFLHVVPTRSEYLALSSHRRRRESNPLRRTSKHSSTPSLQEDNNDSSNSHNSDDDETSSLMSAPGDVEEVDPKSSEPGHSRRADISGLKLLSKVDFYQLWMLLGILTGIGLMTINNIGHDTQVLWSHFDSSADNGFVVKQQLVHVSTISVMSFFGRLSSGIGSDYLVKNLQSSRFWCVAASATIFTLAQVCAITIEDPRHLWALSGLTGLAYGALFGVFPALVVDAFGVGGLSVNWGVMCLSPVVWGNIFNLIYGAILDHHSTLLPGGVRDCPDGLACYYKAYWVTLVASLVGVLLSLWSITHERKVKSRQIDQDGHRGA